MKRRKSLQSKITNKIVALDVGESIDKTEFMIELYGEDDFFKRRSFDVMVCKAKKTLKEHYPDREIDSSINNRVKRIK